MVGRDRVRYKVELRPSGRAVVRHGKDSTGVSRTRTYATGGHGCIAVVWGRDGKRERAIQNAFNRRDVVKEGTQCPNGT